MYARPATSGPGRSILCGLPFILGDKKPMDPAAGWDKTWAFLKEIGESIEYYPTGTAITLKEFAEGTRWIIAGIMEWDMKRVGHEAAGRGHDPARLEDFHLADAA